MEEVVFSLTSYRGYEREILRIRNDNRSDKKTLDYVEWRYAGEKSPYPPVIFWAHLADGTRVGMASINYRPYWVDDKLKYFALLGDISLNSELRGKGVGRRLLEYASTYMRRTPFKYSFVIPNDAVKKTLESLGWITPEPFDWFVWVVNPAARIYASLRIKIIASALSALYKSIMKIRLSRLNIDDYSIEAFEAFDESFEAFWRSFPKRGTIIRDRSKASLKWRYEEHPCTKYRVIKVFHQGQFVGYIVYSLEDGRTCFVVDILMLENRFIKPAMKMFLKHIASDGNAENVRVKLNISHPYARELHEMGFIIRRYGDIFKTLIAGAEDSAGNLKWFLTRGDKDT